MSCWLNSAFEEEILHYFTSSLYKKHESFSVLQFWAFFKKVLAPFDKHSSNSTSIKRGSSIFYNLTDFWASKNIISKNILHIWFKVILLLDSCFEQKVDIFINSLIIHVFRVRKAEIREIIKNILSCLSGWNIRKIYFLITTACLRIILF